MCKIIPILLDFLRVFSNLVLGSFLVFDKFRTPDLCGGDSRPSDIELASSLGLVNADRSA